MTEATGLVIRAATPDDAAGLVDAYLDSAEHHAQLEPERYFVPDKEAIIARYREGRQHPEDAVAVTLVAVVDGAVVGFVDVKLDRSPDAMHREILFCHIVELAVRESHRSAGIGERLMHAAEAWGRTHGAEMASLEYHVANRRAATFYQSRLGYHVVSLTALKRL
jgi:ribosomal protein S18 acetylase RimI-like enzyme